MLVAVVADDFGYCQRRSKGILELIESGFVTRTSLLVNANASEFAASHFLTLFANKSKDVADTVGSHGIGLHLNLTEGKPVSKVCRVTSLVNPNGCMLGKFGFREKIAREEVQEEDIKTEITSQIKRFEELLGFLPSYVDGHQHVHVLPSVRTVFASVLNQFGVSRTRLPLQIDMKKCSWLESSQMKFYEQVCIDSSDSAQIFEDSSIRHADYFIGLSTSGKNMEHHKIKSAFENVMNESKRKDNSDSFELEFMVHPGYRSLPGEGGCGEGPDDFSLSSDRNHEMEFLQNGLSSLLSDLNLTIARIY